MNAIDSPVRSVGRDTITLIQTVMEIIYLFKKMTTRLILHGRKRISLSQLINQILFIGLDALPLIIAIGAMLGTSITYQLISNSVNIRATSYFGWLMVFILSELSPLLTTIVVIGRSGSAFTTFLGNMKVTREIDALESMGISPLDYLCLPSFLGMIISIVCLNVYFTIAAVVGGITIGVLLSPIPFSLLVNQFFSELTFANLLISSVKCVFFGAAVSTISCYYGLSVGSIRIVPRAVFRTVVTSIIAMLTINILFIPLNLFLKDIIHYVNP